MSEPAAQWVAPSIEPSEIAVGIRHVETLQPPMLQQVIALEEAAFAPCERLGPIIMQQQASLRTSGLLLAEMGTALSGYLLYSRSASAGLITKLAVSGAFQRRGIGSALLRRGILELERSGRRTAPPEIQLHVDPTNTVARRLYESCGFQFVAMLPQYYGDSRDALLMRRPAGTTPTK